MVHLFGIRHHGPGSAWSLRGALETLRPDCLLIEGPPEADGLLPLVLGAEMNPPVALLLYAEDDPDRAVFYPFAEFSPEWQALRYGLQRGLPTHFFDLPIAHRFAQERKAAPVPDPASPQPAVDTAPPDPLHLVAEAAGFSDFEAWWGQLVEERVGSTDVFTAILEVMTAVRDEAGGAQHRSTETLREAHMRQQLRQAIAQGYTRTAVVCGAYHTPALTPQALEKHSNDGTLLEGLPAVPVAATWIPWTFGRLSRASGYGAGIHSPGWYQHLWQSYQPGGAALGVRWLSRIAGLLREEGLDASSAQVIEGVRLADTLAAMRGGARAGLAELSEAAYALFAHGNDLVMGLIEERLIVGERLGCVPAETPAAPLQQDLAQEIKRLRLTQDAAVRELELDLRKEIDLARSQLLHRLHLLGISWGHEANTRGKGTFKEGWQLKWEPEYAVTLIELGRYGQTVATAAGGLVAEMAQAPSSTLQTLADVLERVLLADLPAATGLLLHALERQAAQDNDLLHLMAALPALARIVRYGDVRGRELDTRGDTVGHVVDAFLARICVGLPNAAHSLSDAAAETLFGQLLEVDAAVTTLHDPAQTARWHDTLERLSQGQSHGLIQGRAVRRLLDVGLLPMPEVGRHLALALSDPEPEKASRWLEGFLRGSGLVLLHDAPLLGALDRWLAGLPGEQFVRILPLLRRTFSSFELPERRRIGERVKHIEQLAGGTRPADSDLDHTRGAKVLPLAAHLLGWRAP